MPNKYELRRRALKETKGRSENPFASPRYGDKAQPIEYVPPPRVDRPLLTAVLSAGLFLAIVLLYVQTARHQFTVCDDNVYIYEKPQIVTGVTWEQVKWAFADSHEGNWHPLTWISHMLDWQLFSQGSWEPDNHRYRTSWPGGHHLVSMCIHGTNVVLLFLALRLMTGALWPSFVVAALFGIHPLRVESVAWAAERKDVLCGLFWMASMLAYAYYVRRRPIYQSSLLEAVGTGGIYVLVTVLFGMALLAKSMAVTLPCVFLLLDFWPLARWRGRTATPGPGPGVVTDSLSWIGLAGATVGCLVMFGILLQNSATTNWGGSPTIQWLTLLVASGSLLFLVRWYPILWLAVEKLVWMAMVLYDCQMTVVGQDKGVALNSWEGLPGGPRIVNSLMSIANYLGQMLWPANMAPFYPHPYMLKSGWAGFSTLNYCEAAIGGALLLVVSAAGLVFWRKGYLAVGWFWFLGTLMPVIGILQVGTQARADRYTYLPMIGVYLLAVWALKEVADRWPQTRRGLACAAVTLFTLLGAITFQQVSYWIDSYALFEHAAQVVDENWFAYNHIGIAYDSDAKKMTNGDVNAAQELFAHLAKNFRGPPMHLDDALGQALGYTPEEFKAAAQKLDPAQRQQLVADYRAKTLKLTLPQKQELLFDYSADAFNETLVIKPDYDFGNNNLGVYYARKTGDKNLALAEKYFRGALRSNQRYADAYNNLGIILARQGDEAFSKGDLVQAEKKFEDSIQCHIAGLNVRYDRASDHNNLCRAYLRLRDVHLKMPGHADQAKADLDLAMRENAIALQCDPNFPGAVIARYDICIGQNNFAEAARCVQRLIDIDPVAPDTIRQLMTFASTCLNANHADDAIEPLNQFLKVNPDVPNFYYARALIYMKQGNLDAAKHDLQRIPRYPGVEQQLNEIRMRQANPPRAEKG